ncbi:MAG TPA: hypothetical protein VE956_11105 [Nodularia sp. (in: cyanobacteria)]|nr:hypothetical protein [Nodularia sp. (in: cyanobacteria)]
MRENKGNLYTLEQLSDRTGISPLNVRFSPDSRLIAVAGWD